MSASLFPDREAIGDLPNPMGLAGIEFIEYTTSRPQALGQLLEQMGFRPVARHRSREVLLYRQGDIHIIVNGHQGGLSGQAQPQEAPRLAAVALRVRDAAAAYQRALDLGAWAVPSQVEVMELNIPAIHGVGDTRIYFVDRWREFSIYDVDFVPVPGVDLHPPALHGLHVFGVVQYIGLDRLDDWTTFYGELFGFASMPREQSFGVLSTGSILASPCGQIYWQLIEPEPDTADFEGDELLHRVAFGCDDVLATVADLRTRGLEFVESTHGVRTQERGALTQTRLGSVSFELVRDPR
ncbi:4-hydroxyphenylpyruvate dioxygenase [Sphaerotilus hippei]|uniref:4-hydroxyphenylpyruvate dioxygenase n=1 Tax=Sphaerotilus hippei TaxID=744406 RepID=A0A318GWQ9_9BURK|nr:4-hydroxyphenylpyruvate dioxygenase [Sphaerotilus hippei]PXW94029.1 4-hydroxyphenylpyruvate dioxygenase [Sphaerotilus hippei]